MTDPVRIQTGARIHFGLLDVRPPFGGAGVMVAHPATEVIARPAERFDPGHFQADRIAAIAARWAADHDQILPAVGVEVTRRPRLHCGFGSGTQLSMAVAEAIDRATGGVPTDATIRRWAGRGLRSAVGSVGYRTGGLVIEDSARGRWHQVVTLPTGWRIALLTPRKPEQLVAGAMEQQLFDGLPIVSPAIRDRLRRILTDEVLPAALGGEFDGFAGAVTEYNRASGDLFAAAQGGPYSPAAAATIKRLQQLGVKHFGQSSWGPGVFAWFPDEATAGQFASRWDGAQIDCQITRVVPVGDDVFLPGRGDGGSVN